MNLGEIMAGTGGTALVLLTLLEIAPLKLNPWSFLAKSLGRALNGDIVAQMKEMEGTMQHLQDQLEFVRKEAEEQAAINARARILRFGDEILHGEKQTKDHFDQTLRDIDTYTDYCREHPEFPNHITELTAKRIEEVYLERLATNDFL